MKRTKRLGLSLLVLGTLCLVCSVIIPFNMFLPAWKHWEGTTTIEPMSARSVSLGLFWGTTIEVLLFIGGGNNDIYFSIRNSLGDTVVESRRVYGPYYFGPFFLSDNTYYTFIFSNSMSIFTTKSVYWIVRAYWYNLAFLIVGILFMVIGALMMLYESTVKQKLGEPKGINNSNLLS